MLQDKNGKITMSAMEREQYLSLTKASELPTTMVEFEQGLRAARQAHQQRIDEGVEHPGGHILYIRAIDDVLANPHESQYRDYMRRWNAAGRPVGQAEHRAAGLL
jgi:hypothetical protein